MEYKIVKYRLALEATLYFTLCLVFFKETFVLQAILCIKIWHFHHNHYLRLEDKVNNVILLKIPLCYVIDVTLTITQVQRV